MKFKQENRNAGFTLIELLMVVAIIGVLSTLALGVMQSAADDAKESATIARIRMIQSILTIEMEDYEVRRLPVPVGPPGNGGTLMGAVQWREFGGPSSTMAPNMMHHVRQLKRRIVQEIINVEFPRPLVVDDGNGNPELDADGNLQFKFNDDVGRFPSQNPAAGNSGNDFEQYLVDTYGPGFTNSFRQFPPAKVQRWNNYMVELDNSPDIDRTFFNLPGEYLYLILQSIDIDGESAIEILGHRAVGDSDGDGIPEIVDAWGDSLQMRVFQLGAVLETTAADDIWTDNAVADFDAGSNIAIPVGYSVLDPTVPRELDKIRFDVISINMDRHTSQ